MPRRKSKSKVTSADEVSAADEAVSNEINAAAEETSTPEPVLAKRSRRSTTAAQTAASHAGARVTRSVTRTPSEERIVPNRKARATPTSTESPALRVKSSPRCNKVSYHEDSDGEDDKVDNKPEEEDEFQVEDDEIESDSEESRDASKLKLARGRLAARSKKPNRKSKGRPAASSRRSNAAKALDEEDAPEQPTTPKPRRQSRTSVEHDELEPVDSTRSKRRKSKASVSPEPTTTRRSGRARKTLKEDLAGAEFDDDEEEENVVDEEGEDESYVTEVEPRASKKRKVEIEEESEAKKMKSEKIVKDETPMDVNEEDTATTSKPVKDDVKTEDKIDESKSSKESELDANKEKSSVPAKSEKNANIEKESGATPSLGKIEDLSAITSKVDDSSELSKPVENCDDDKSENTPPPVSSSDVEKDASKAAAPVETTDDSCSRDSESVLVSDGAESKSSVGITKDPPNIETSDECRTIGSAVKNESSPKELSLSPNNKVSPCRDSPPKSSNDNNVHQELSTSVNSPIKVQSDIISSDKKADSENAISTESVDRPVNGNKIFNDEKVKNGTSECFLVSESLKGRKVVPSAKCPEGDFCKFGIVSYNLGGNDVASQHDKLLLELKALNGDILCLQDVNVEYFNDKLFGSLKLLGYCGEVSPSGLATLYKTSVASDVCHKSVSIAELLKDDFKMSGLDDASQNAVQKYLESQKLGHGQYSQFKVGSKVLNVANIKLLPCDISTHTVQVSCLVRELLNQTGSDAINSQVLCGTFNVEQGWPAYQLIRDGYLNNEMIETLQKQENINIPNKGNSSLINLLWKCFQHPSSYFKSSYSTIIGREMANDSSDSIWFSSDTLFTSYILDIDGSSDSHSKTSLKAGLLFTD